MTGSSGIVTGPEMIHGQGCMGGPPWFKEPEQDQYVLPHQLPLPSFLEPMLIAGWGMGKSEAATLWPSCSSGELLFVFTIISSAFTGSVEIPCLDHLRVREAASERWSFAFLTAWKMRKRIF